MSGVIKESLKIMAAAPGQSMPEAHVFNSSNFLLNKPFEVKGWQLVSDKPKAQIFFYINNKVAISGYRSTFGSFDISDNVTPNELKWFVGALVKVLKEEGVKKIKIKHFPSYFANADYIGNVLVEYGFETVLTETNQHIIINQPNFEDVADRSEVIRSNKCNRLGYKFKIASLDELPQIYKLIEDTLLRKGNIPSMSYLNLKNTIEDCPDNYILFTLWDGNILIAATVSIKINNTVLYNFYHADHLEYRIVSAFTFLLKTIYLYCLKNNFKFLDLGISTVNGVLNKGLFNFKKARGAVNSDKNYYNLTV